MATPLHPQQSGASLYVGDLHHEVTEAILFQLFSAHGHVSSIRVCRDFTTRRSLGYAYVNFQSQAEAKAALENLNFQPILGFPCRIMWSSRDPTIRKSALGNLYVKGLDSNVDNQRLYLMFSQFGSILSCKVALDRNGDSKGFGFVHFAKEDDAKKCLETLNGKTLPDNQKPLSVNYFQKRANRATNLTAFTNIYVKFIPRGWRSEDFKGEFERFGVISSAFLKEGQGFGFVNYATHEEALRAIEEAASQIQVPAGEKPLYVTRFQTSEERKATLDKQIIEYKRQNYERFKGRNLHVKNLEEDVNEEELQKAFSNFGRIISIKIERERLRNKDGLDVEGPSKCFGYVCFENSSEAKKALDDMNMAVLDGRSKPIHVSLFQTKEERKAFLEQQHQQMSSMRPIPYPIYLPPMQNLQYVTQRQMYTQQPIALRQQPFRGRPAMAQTQRPNSYPPPQQLQPQQQPQQQQQHRLVASQMKTRDNLGDFTKILTSLSTEEEQKHMLGEKLFPLVYQLRPNEAAKITGMILELDVSDLISFLESKELLVKKVEEAVGVLNEFNNRPIQ